MKPKRGQFPLSENEQFQTYDCDLYTDLLAAVGGGGFGGGAGRRDLAIGLGALRELFPEDDGPFILADGRSLTLT